jgi:hypothetical protein
MFRFKMLSSSFEILTASKEQRRVKVINEHYHFSAYCNLTYIRESAFSPN